MRTCAARPRRTGSRRSGRIASDAPDRAPTSARQCQQRSHFGACSALTAIDSASPRAHARRGRDQHEAQVVAERRERRDSSSASATMSTSACSDEPIAPAWRTASSSFCTSARTARIVSQRAASASASGNGGQHAVPRVHEDRRIAGAQDRPRFFGGERQDRRHQFQQCVADQRQRRLRRAPRRRCRRPPCTAGPSARRDKNRRDPRSSRSAGAARRDGTRNARNRWRPHRPSRAPSRARTRSISSRSSTGTAWRSRIEIRRVRHQEAQRVADPPVAFDDALQDLVGDRQARPSSRSPRPTAAGFPHRACRRPSAARRRCPSTSTSSGLRRRRRTRASAAPCTAARRSACTTSAATNGTSRDAGPILRDTGPPENRYPPDASRRSSGGRRARPSPSGASCPNRTTRRACRSACDSVSRRRRSPRSSPRTSFRCRPPRPSSPRARAAPACPDATLRSCDRRRTAAAFPIAVAATASSRDDWRSSRAAAPCPMSGKNCVASMPRSAVARSGSAGFVPRNPGTSSMPANHCVVAR